MPTEDRILLRPLVLSSSYSMSYIRVPLLPLRLLSCTRVTSFVLSCTYAPGSQNLHELDANLVCTLVHICSSTFCFSVFISFFLTVSTSPNCSSPAILMGLTVTPIVVDFLAGSANSTSAPALLVCSQEEGRSIRYPCLGFTYSMRPGC